MRVFIYSPGRCGTTVFNRACNHITNYQNVRRVDRTVSGDKIGRVSGWPDNAVIHDLHLIWSMPEIIEAYPDSKHVLLLRDREACAKSLAQRHYTNGILHLWHCEDENKIPSTRLKAAQWYYDFVCTQYHQSVAAGGLNGNQITTLYLEKLQEFHFEFFWSWIDAEGDLEKALETFDTIINQGD